jgi:hypothetical protein
MKFSFLRVVDFAHRKATAGTSGCEGTLHASGRSWNRVSNCDMDDQKYARNKRKIAIKFMQSKYR